MENLSFVLWMILFPFGCTVEKYIYQTLMGKTYTDGVKLAAGLTEFVLWIVIAQMLYV